MDTNINLLLFFLLVLHFKSLSLFLALYLTHFLSCSSSKTGQVNVMDFGRVVLSDPRAPKSRRGSQRGHDQRERGLAGLDELCFGLLQLMERFLPGATSGDLSPSDVSDKDFSRKM